MTTAIRIASAITVLTFGSFFLTPVFAQDATSAAQAGEELVTTTNQTSIKPPNTAASTMPRPKLPVLTPALKNRVAQDSIQRTGGLATRESQLIKAKENMQMRIASKEAYLIENLRMKFTLRREELLKKMATREAVLKRKLDAFKDKEKAIIAQQVSNNLNMVNKNRTDQMNKNLGLFANILNRLQNIALQSASKGKDITTVQEAIDKAEDAIASAQEIVNIQAGNDYTLVVSSESKAKEDAKSKRDQLETDLKTAHQAVINARQSVIDIVPMIRSLIGGLTNGQ